MTILAGMICSDGIVLGSDSQNTSGNSKRHVAKISEVKFVNGCALVAESGESNASGIAVQIFQDLAQAIILDSHDDAERILAEAVRLEKMKQMEQMPEEISSFEQWHEFFSRDDQKYELLAAFWIRGKPYLYKIIRALGLPGRINSHAATCGMGGDLAAYVLSECSKAGMDTGLGLMVITHVVETVCRFSAYCDPPTRLAILSPTPDNADGILSKAMICPIERVAEIVSMVERVEQQAQADRNKRFLDGMREIADAALKRFFADF